MRTLPGLALAMITLPLTGCQFFQQPKPESSSRGVLDVQAVRPPVSRYAQPVQVTPPEEPTVAISVEPTTTVTPSFKGAHAAGHKAVAVHVQQASDQSSYKVKKGDTLYRIAKTEYGDGKKWTLIASANPGLSPQSLKSGQTIVIP